MASFSDMVEDMDEQIMFSLADAIGMYRGPELGPVHSGIDLIIDRDVGFAGPEGMLLADAIGITWRRVALPCAERGGIFTVGSTRYVIEKVISDDGHMVTAACMEDE